MTKRCQVIVTNLKLLPMQKQGIALVSAPAPAHKIPHLQHNDRYASSRTWLPSLVCLCSGLLQHWHKEHTHHKFTDADCHIWFSPISASKTQTQAHSSQSATVFVRERLCCCHSLRFENATRHISLIRNLCGVTFIRGVVIGCSGYIFFDWKETSE